jgi:hypothetical protein
LYGRDFGTWFADCTKYSADDARHVVTALMTRRPMKGASQMEQELTRTRQHEGKDGFGEEIRRLLRLVRRLEIENASLRRELAAGRPVAA